MLVSALLTAAIALSLQAQSLGSPLAAAWLMPFLLACAVAKGKAHRDAVWYTALAWLIVLGASTFFIRPIIGAAVTMWILAAAPMVCLSLRREHLAGCLHGALLVLLLFAGGLMIQEALDVRYTIAWEPHSGRSWPVIDANNAACILNFGLIGSLWLATRRREWTTKPGKLR